MPLTIANVQSGTTSFIGSGKTAAAPAANTLIVDCGVLPAGNSTPVTYLVSAITGQTGTPDTNGTNILVNVGGTNTSGTISGGTTYGPLTSFGCTSGTPPPQVFRLLIPAGGAHVYVCTGNAAGGASAVYTAGVTITRLNSSGGWYF